VPLHDPERMVKGDYELRKSVGRLREVGAISRDAFMKDPDKIAAAKYHLIVAVEAATDLCHHLIARNMYRIPNDYEDTFRVMGEAGALPPELVAELGEMAQLRNRFVYFRSEADDEAAYETARNRLNTLKTFLDALSKFLGKDHSRS
jgi:uncharacterized protein YutE (UPF0331/DUF86 family)